MERRPRGAERDQAGNAVTAARSPRALASLVRGARSRRGHRARARGPTCGAPRPLAVAAHPRGRIVTGRVVLVGAGPGDPELITVRGARALQEADVVVYDRLVSPALLELAPARAQRVYVGKQASRAARAPGPVKMLLV